MTAVGLAGVAAALVAAVHGGSLALERGTIHPGRGVGPVELGMTRAQVVAKLGAPLATNGSHLQYSRDNVFDVDLDAKGRVIQITASGARFCTPGGACLLQFEQRRAAPARVPAARPPDPAVRPAALHPRRDEARREADVHDVFGDRHAPKPTVLEVYVSYCAEGCP